MSPETPADLLPMKFNPSDARIAEVRSEHETLLANLPALIEAEDIGQISAALKGIVPLRTEIERVRQNLKYEALTYGRKVDAEAKRLTGLVLAFETPIRNAKEEIEARERQRAEEKIAAEEALARQEREAEQKAQEALREAERQRIAAEAEKLAQERANFERVRREEEERQAAMRADLIARERKLREAELKERLEKEAAEKAHRDATEAVERLNREAAEKSRLEKEAALRDEEERKAAEDAKPDVQKVNDFGAEIAMWVSTLFPRVKLNSRAASALSGWKERLLAIGQEMRAFKAPAKAAK